MADTINTEVTEVAENETVAVEEPKKPAKVKDPVKELKKEIKRLNEELVCAETKADAYKGMLNSFKEQLEQKEKQLNGLAAEYSRITNYIKDTLKVAHQSILMVMKED